ncbi:uncharacterized protein [Centruroides vittatus]|uniref:uncharacterized protein n=1 Tax=Centruroides vittatus TaxID=120091 RepID=UPI00350EAEC9
MTAPNSSLQVISRKPPISDIIEIECDIWNLKLGTDINLPAHHLQACNYEHSSPFSQSIPPYINDFIGTTPPHHPDLEIFTDGSGLNDRIGCAFVTFQNSIEIYNQINRLDCTCSVFQAELQAINLAINWTDQHYNHKTVHIIGDSSSAVQLIHGSELHPIATAIRKSILKSNNFYSITWTRAHNGTAGNERADQLAKSATNDDSLEIIYNKICHRSVRKLIFEELLNR